MLRRFLSLLYLFALVSVFTIGCAPEGGSETLPPGAENTDVEGSGLGDTGETAPSGTAAAAQDPDGAAVVDPRAESQQQPLPTDDPAADPDRPAVVDDVPVEPSTAVGVPIPSATVVARGFYLAYDNPDPQFYVITKEADWMAFWQTYAPGGDTNAPPVDFGHAFVLIGIQGNKSSAGYEITFTGLAQRGDEVHVMTQLKEPGAEEIVDMAFTQPYIAVQVPNARVETGRPLTFIFETESGQELGRVQQSIGG